MMARQYLLVCKWKISWQRVKNRCKDTASYDMGCNINDQSGNRWNVITCAHALTKCKHTCSSSNTHILSLYSVSLHSPTTTRCCLAEHWQNKTCLKCSFDPESTVRNISQFCCSKRQVTKMSKLFNTTFISSKRPTLVFPTFVHLGKLNSGCIFLPAALCFTFVQFHTFTPGPFMTSFPSLATGVLHICHWHWGKFAGIGHQEIRLYKQTHVVRKRTDIIIL